MGTAAACFDDPGWSAFATPGTQSHQSLLIHAALAAGPDRHVGDRMCAHNRGSACCRILSWRWWSSLRLASGKNLARGPRLVCDCTHRANYSSPCGRGVQRCSAWHTSFALDDSAVKEKNNWPDECN